MSTGNILLSIKLCACKLVNKRNRKQVDILISKNQVLQMTYFEYHVYEAS